MSISKTTINYAAKRNVSVTLEVIDNQSMVWVSAADNDCEPAFTLFANNDGSFTYKGRVTAPQSLISEIPAHYQDEKALRKMIDFVAEFIS